MSKPPIHGRDHSPGGADPIPNDPGDIRYDYLNVGDWLDVETTDYMYLHNSGDGQMRITDEGALGVSIEAVDRIWLQNFGGDNGIQITQYDAGTKGIYITDNTTDGLWMYSAGPVDIESDAIRLEALADGTVQLFSTAIANPGFGNKLTIGKYDATSSYIGMGNQGGSMTITEQGGIVIQNLVGSIFIESSDTHGSGTGLIIMDPLIAIPGRFDVGTGHPSSQGTNEFQIYVYTRPSDGFKELTAEVGGTRTVLAVGP